MEARGPLQRASLRLTKSGGHATKSRSMNAQVAPAITAVPADGDGEPESAPLAVPAARPMYVKPESALPAARPLLPEFDAFEAAPPVPMYPRDVTLGVGTQRKTPGRPRMPRPPPYP